MFTSYSIRGIMYDFSKTLCGSIIFVSMKRNVIFDNKISKAGMYFSGFIFKCCLTVI